MGNSLGEALKRARKRAGLSQSELALETGLSLWTISAAENNRYAPRITTLRLIADATGVDVAGLVDLQEASA